MTELREVTNLPRGARFIRADLHIHSCAGSHDVKDNTATPESIVDAAISEGLSLVAVTDHNEISASEIASTHVGLRPLLVVPAVELSTPQGHLLCYLPTIDALKRFHGQLTILGRGTQESRCTNSLIDCLEKLSSLHGFGVLAHVDAEGGFEVSNPGGSPHKRDVLCHAALLGIELRSAASPISYSDTDEDPVRAEIGQERIRRLRLGSKQFLARVLNSDSHSLRALGRNVAGDRKVTRYKMNSLTFESLRIALYDADARVRIEDEVPPTVPYIRGMRLSGGFLDGQSIHFGPNLNCIIGGRGTGKSTAFEAIRCVAGQSGGTSVIDSDVWPQQIDLLVEDQAGQVHKLTRAKHGEVENSENQLDGPNTFAVECYGQGETHQISQRAQSDPAALLSYLDRFVNIGPEQVRERQLRDLLLTLQTQIEEAAQKVELIPQFERNLKATQAQIAAATKANVKDIIALQRKIEHERHSQRAILEHAQEISKTISRDDIRSIVAAIRSAATKEQLVVGASEFGAINTQVDLFEADLMSAEKNLEVSSAALSSVVRTQLAAWRTKEQAVVAEIEEKKRKLEAAGVHVDLTYIQKLASDEARLKQDVANLGTWKTRLADARKQRKDALAARWAIRDKIAGKRIAFAQTASESLRSAMFDLNVSLKFEPNGYSPEANDIIVEAMGWRTVQVPRASALTETLTVPKLIDAISRKASTPIEEVTVLGGGRAFSKSEAIALIGRLSQDAVRFRLERCEVFDRPRLMITKPVVDSNGETHYRTREFRNLSLGQQQSVLLALMLSANSNIPLIIDQPEDNLDGEFIYKSVVPVLRRAKERRQVIIVTHNANIAVLGDAEQILVLRGTNEKAIISSRGSIDDSQIREDACAVLEGSREAFQRRATIYGAGPST